MAEEKFISKFDGTTENKLLDIINQNQGVFPFDSELNEQSQHGLTNAAIAKEINAIKDATSNNKGYFLTEEALKNAYPVANNGSKAYVGSNYPYKIYLHASGMWVDTGQTGGDEGFNAGEFYTKTQIDQKTEAINTEITRVEKGANYEVLEYETNVATTRLKVPEKNRKAGYMITYNPGTGWIKELYTGAQLTNEEWIKDENWKVEIPSDDIQGVAEEVSSLAESAASNAALAQEKAGEADDAAKQAAQLVSEAQQSITEATEAAGEANAAAEAAREAAESIGEKQGAGKPVGTEYSEVFNNLTGNSVDGASHAHAEGNVTYAWGDGSHAEGNGHKIRENQGVTHESPKEEIEAAWNINQTQTLPDGQQFHMAYGRGSHAEGEDNLVTGENSHAGGHANKVTGKNNLVSGHQNIVGGDNNLVEGVYNTVGKRLAEPSTQEETNWDGSCNVVTGRRHTVKGRGNAVSGMTNTAPLGTEISGDNNVAHGSVDVIGNGNFALMNQIGDYGSNQSLQQVEGDDNFVVGGSVVGNRNVVIRPAEKTTYGTENLIVFGGISKASGEVDAKDRNNVVVGGFINLEEGYNATDNIVIKGSVYKTGSQNVYIRGNIVLGGYSYGANNIAIGGTAGNETGDKTDCIAIGNYAQARDTGSVAIGNGARAYGEGSVAISHDYAITHGRYSVAVGSQVSAEGAASFAACKGNISYGEQSVSMGIQCLAYGNYAFALGGGGIVPTADDIEDIAGNGEPESAALNKYSTSYYSREDSYHIAYGKGSLVTGKNNLALGDYSSAHGEGNVAYKDHQFIVGKFGQYKENIAFAVGWGTYYGNRTNAFEVLNDGSAALKGSLSQSSDIRLKENVKDLESKGSLRLVEFDWKNGNGHSYGFIADEVEKIYPDMVSEDSSGYKVLNYNAAMCAKLAELENTIKKQQEMIDKLEKLI